MKLRLLKKSDIVNASKIVMSNYGAHDSKLVKYEMKVMFTKGPFLPTYIIAEENKKMIGFAGFSQSWIDYSVYQIFWVNVEPTHQNKGIGKKIVRKIISEIKKKKNSKIILLSTTIPAYYKKHFKFEILTSFKGKNHRHCVMSLKI